MAIFTNHMSNVLHFANPRFMQISIYNTCLCLYRAQCGRES